MNVGEVSQLAGELAASRHLVTLVARERHRPSCSLRPPLRSDGRSLPMSRTWTRSTRRTGE